jgi:hypothetical protein
VPLFKPSVNALDPLKSANAIFVLAVERMAKSPNLFNWSMSSAIGLYLRSSCRPTRQKQAPDTDPCCKGAGRRAGRSRSDIHSGAIPRAGWERQPVPLLRLRAHVRRKAAAAAAVAAAFRVPRAATLPRCVLTLPRCVLTLPRCVITLPR